MMDVAYHVAASLDGLICAACGYREVGRAPCRDTPLACFEPLLDAGRGGTLPTR